LKQPLAQKVHIRITRAGFVVNIKCGLGDRSGRTRRRKTDRLFTIRGDEAQTVG